ncbi:MAG: hypothetical protein ACYCTI_09965 [Acidimicrobiales bacterium]
MNPRSGRGLATGAVLACVSLVSVACGKAAPATAAHRGAHIASLPASALPADLDGLTVTEEKSPAGVSSDTGSYASSLGFFSLRKDKLVEATLEVVKLGRSADASSSSFQESLVNQINGGVPVALTLAGRQVYEAGGTGVGLTSWFDGRYFFVLTIRATYPTPRALIEAALAVNVA